MVRLLIDFIEKFTIRLTSRHYELHVNFHRQNVAPKTRKIT